MKPTVEEMKEQVIQALRAVYDPEIPVNIHDLGLIYRLAVDEDGKVEVDMTLTAPHCPVAESLPGQVEAMVRQVPGVSDVKLQLVWDPPWTPERMSEVARAELNFF